MSSFSAKTGTDNPLSGIDVGSVSAPTFGDIDGDGDLDMFVGEGDGVFNYYRNVGTARAPVYDLLTGTDNPLSAYDPGDLSAPAFGDVDGDGDLDVVAGADHGGLAYYQNTGTATAPGYSLLLGGIDPFRGIVVAFNSKPALVDIDGDGDLDLAVGAFNGILSYYRNTGTAKTPVYAPQTGADNPFGGIVVPLRSAPAFGDIDRDGDQDLVVGDGFGAWSYYLNTGTATAPVYARQTGATNPFAGLDVGDDAAPQFVDLDRDGDLDLVVGANDGLLNYYQHTATPAAPPVFAAVPGTSNPFGSLVTDQARSPSLGDVDGDGDLDLVVGQENGLLRYYSNTGTATAPASAEQLGAANPFFLLFSFLTDDSTPSLGDIDGDGDLDLVVGDVEGKLVYFRNTGTATTPTYARQTGTDNPFNGIDAGRDHTPSEDGIDLSAPALGDIDGDGDIDLVVGGSSGALLYYRNNGDATTPVYAQQTGTANPFDGLSGGAFSAPSLGDIDGDGDLDLVVGQAFDTMFYFSNTGNATEPVFAQQTGTANPFGSLPVGFENKPTLGDIDADGDIDLVVGNLNGDVLTFTNNDAPTLRQAAINGTGTNEDTNSPGDTVAALLAAAGLADVDAGALKGLAVTGTTGQGEWQYNTGSAVWTPFGAVSATAALLLADGTSVRYVPDANNGETATFSFRAWDQSRGTASVDNTPGTADTTTNGGGTAFSTASSTASLVVSDVNDAPTLSQSAFNLPATDEDTTAGTTVAALLAGAGWNDVDIGALQGISVSAHTGLGLWQWTTEGSFWAPFDFSNDDSVALGLNASLRYVPNGVNGETATLSFRAWDRTEGSASVSVPDGPIFSSLPQAPVGGTSSQSTTKSTASLLVNAINDAPTNSPVTLPAMAEDSGTLTITQALLLGQAFDADGPALKAENLQIVGSLGSLVDNGNGSWNYTPAANDDTSVSFSYRVSDGTDTVAGSATLDLTPVNDPPVALADSAVTRLNAPVSIAVLANDSDVDGGPLQVVAVAPGTGGSAAVQPGGLTVLFTPNTGFSGFGSFNYTVSDGVGGTAVGSVRVLVPSITGTNGNDTLLGTLQADFVLALDGNDRILTHDGDDYVDGGRGVDTITGGAGADTLLGGEGPDTFLATSSELAGDQIDGGEGTDTLVITNAPASLPANFSFTNLELISYTGALLVEHTNLLDLSSLTLAGGSSNNLIGGAANSRITGTASADNITDSAGSDDLRGAGGNDTITGGFGQDTINGGIGNDVLYGGSATAPNDFVRDIFVFNTPLNAATNVDQIIGFQANSQDQIQLSGSIFGAIAGGATAGLDADEFRSAAGGNALDGNDFILFDPATGNLFYDADGSGPGARVLFATLVGLTGVLDAADVVVGAAP